MADLVNVERRGEMAVLTLNRPEVRNALNYELLEEAGAALTALNADEACRAVVLTGADDKAFCAGMDIRLARTLNEHNVGDWMARLKAFYETIRGLDKPCVAAVNGVAAGAGYQVALLADMRVGHAGARMGQPEINVGLASILGTQIMYPHLGHARTVELSLTGRLMDGEECHRLGLFNRLVSEDAVLDTALDVARELAQKPPVAMRLSKQRLREMTQADFDAAFEAGARMQIETYRSGEPADAMNRFLEKKRR